LEPGFLAGNECAHLYPLSVSKLFRCRRAASSELGLAPVEFGWLASAFFGSFAVLQIPVGIAFDRWGMRLPMTLMMITGAAGSALLRLHPISGPPPLVRLRSELDVRRSAFSTISDDFIHQTKPPALRPR
jgi:hypothetical protein